MGLGTWTSQFRTSSGPGRARPGLGSQGLAAASFFWFCVTGVSGEFQRERKSTVGLGEGTEADKWTDRQADRWGAES